MGSGLARAGPRRPWIGPAAGESAGSSRSGFLLAEGFEGIEQPRQHVLHELGAAGAAAHAAAEELLLERPPQSLPLPAEEQQEEWQWRWRWKEFDVAPDLSGLRSRCNFLCSFLRGSYALQPRQVSL